MDEGCGMYCIQSAHVLAVLSASTRLGTTQTRVRRSVQLPHLLIDMRPHRAQTLLRVIPHLRGPAHDHPRLFLPTKFAVRENSGAVYFPDRGLCLFDVVCGIIVSAKLLNILKKEHYIHPRTSFYEEEENSTRCCDISTR